jgi:hypothetical protein
MLEVNDLNFTNLTQRRCNTSRPLNKKNLPSNLQQQTCRRPTTLRTGEPAQYSRHLKTVDDIISTTTLRTGEPAQYSRHLKTVDNLDSTNFL